jgi:hypothetical protein
MNVCPVVDFNRRRHTTVFQKMPFVALNCVD